MPKLTCPHCQLIVQFDQEFSEHDGANVACPKCDEIIDIRAVLKESLNANLEHEESGDGDSDADEGKAEIFLPPKFLADDPDFVDHSVSGQRSSRVLLPDGAGGVSAVDSNIVRIEHRGQTVELKALSPEKKRFRQRWINIVSILLGAAFLWMFFRWIL